MGRLAADLSRVLHPRQRMGVRWVNRRLTAARASGVGYILADDPGLRQPYAISSMCTALGVWLSAGCRGRSFASGLTTLCPCSHVRRSTTRMAHAARGVEGQ